MIGASHRIIQSVLRYSIRSVRWSFGQLVAESVAAIAQAEAEVSKGNGPCGRRSSWRRPRGRSVREFPADIDVGRNAAKSVDGGRAKRPGGSMT